MSLLLFYEPSAPSGPVSGVLGLPTTVTINLVYPWGTELRPPAVSTVVDPAVKFTTTVGQI